MFKSAFMLLVFGYSLSFARAGCRFDKHPRHALYGFNSRIVTDVRTKECSQQCLQISESADFPCQSFDYNPRTQTCFLSAESRSTQPGAYGKHGEMDYYEKVCGDNVEDASGGSNEESDESEFSGNGSGDKETSWISDDSNDEEDDYYDWSHDEYYENW